jgi:hypothetical protein
MATVTARVPIPSRMALHSGDLYLIASSCNAVRGGLGDGNRTCAVSLGTVRTHGWVCARRSAGFGVTSGPECPMNARANGTGPVLWEFDLDPSENL